MASNRTSGNLLGLQIDGQFIACEMSCDFNWENEILPASPKIEGRWDEGIYGARSWSVSVSAAVLFKTVGYGLPQVLNAFMLGNKMLISFRTKFNEDLPTFNITGWVLVQGGGISASAYTNSNWTANLKGNGPFVIEYNNTINILTTDAAHTTGLETGNGLLATQPGNDLNGLSSTSGLLPGYGNSQVANSIKNANTNSPIETLRIGHYTTEDFPTGDLPDDLITIVTD